jgi:DNA excision repair protein ERCC-4
MIRVDVHEPTIIFEYITKLAKAERAPLDVADYHFDTYDGKHVLIERKTGSDLLSSIGNNRLRNQVGRMSRVDNAIPIVLVEGYIGAAHDGTVRLVGSRSETRWPYTVVEIFLLGCQFAGTYVISSANEICTAHVIVDLAKHFAKADYATIHERAKVKLEHAGECDLRDMQIDVITSLPGIGPHMARAMLDHFGTPIRLFSASIEDMCQVRGIGEKRAVKIREILSCRDIKYNK